LAKLQFVKLRIEIAGREQLLVRAAFNDPTVFNDEDCLSSPDCREAVSNRNRRFALD
jgi:hypothetical protein